jgi:DNA-directed RNA polymerase subunit RPC12/RpoP
MGFISKNRSSSFGFLSHSAVLEQLLADAAACLDGAAIPHHATQCPPIPDPFYVNLLHASDLAMLHGANTPAFNAGSPNPSSDSSVGGGRGGGSSGFGGSGGGDGRGIQSSRVSDTRRKFKCPRCTSTFSRKDNLKTHQRLHSGEMPFECRYCSRKFMWQSSARTHELTHQRTGRTRRAHVPSSVTNAAVISNAAAVAGGTVRVAAAATQSECHSTEKADNSRDYKVLTGECWPPREKDEPQEVSHDIEGVHALASETIDGLTMLDSVRRTVPCPDGTPAGPVMPVIVPPYSAPPLSLRHPGSPSTDTLAGNHGSLAVAPVTVLTNRSTGRRLAVPQLQFSTRGSACASIHPNSAALFTIDEYMDADDTGRDVGAQAPITPQCVAESPMFGPNRISQHDLERYMETVIVPDDEQVEEYRNQAQ